MEAGAELLTKDADCKHMAEHTRMMAIVRRWMFLRGVALVALLTACGGPRPPDARHAPAPVDAAPVEARPADAMASVVPQAGLPDAAATVGGAPPTGPVIKFHVGMFSQCTGTLAEDQACRGTGPSCMYLAMVPHPCAHSGARCTPERERVSHGNFPACVCSCSKQWQDWQRAQDARYRDAPPPP